MSNFLDEAKVTFRSGNGGNGAASFHTEKHVPRGGPNGANGGRGGDIILVADRHKRTLYDFQLLDHYKADDGVHAVGPKAGKDAKDIILKVPLGTIVYDLDLDEQLVDLSIHGMKYVVCKGGRGGLGNLHFTNSVRQTPKFAQKGAPGDIVHARLELKLIADAGLIGLPNAGKSTLLSALSAAKPKIADYPFTTLSPNLGVVSVGDETYVLADLPGMIEGASEGIGLGFQFLKHAERNKVLLHLVDGYPIDESVPFENFQMIESELKKYSEELYARPRIVAINKADVGIPEAEEEVLKPFKDAGIEFHVISAVSGQGLTDLKWALLKAIQDATPQAQDIQVLVAEPKARDDSAWDVDVVDGDYVVTGRRILRLVAMTDLEKRDALMYLHRKLKRIGVIERLEELGAQEGDTVVIGDYVFAYSEW